MQYEEFRKAGHYLVDYIASYLQNVEDKPLFPDVEPSFLNELFDESLPDKPISLKAIQQLFSGISGVTIPVRNFS